MVNICHQPKCFTYNLTHNHNHYYLSCIFHLFFPFPGSSELPYKQEKWYRSRVKQDHFHTVSWKEWKKWLQLWYRVFNKRSKGDRIVRTVSQACDVDLAEIHCGCHSNIKGALGNVISTIGHSNSKRTLRQRRQEADGCDHTNYYVGKGGQTNAALTYSIT